MDGLKSVMLHFLILIRRSQQGPAKSLSNMAAAASGRALSASSGQKGLDGRGDFQGRRIFRALPASTDRSKGRHNNRLAPVSTRLPPFVFAELVEHVGIEPPVLDIDGGHAIADLGTVATPRKSQPGQIRDRSTAPTGDRLFRRLGLSQEIHGHLLRRTRIASAQFSNSPTGSRR